MKDQKSLFKLCILRFLKPNLETKTKPNLPDRERSSPS